MKNPRKIHAGKSQVDRQFYNRMLKSQQSEDPTFEDEESTPTNTVSPSTPSQTSVTPPILKQYKRDHAIPWRDIIVGLIIFAVTTVLFLFGMSLNREIGVLSEKVDTTKSNVTKIEAHYDSLKHDLENIKVDVEVIKRNGGK